MYSGTDKDSRPISVAQSGLLQKQLGEDLIKKLFANEEVQPTRLTPAYVPIRPTPAHQPIRLPPVCLPITFTPSHQPIRLLPACLPIRFTASRQPIRLPPVCLPIRFTPSRQPIRLTPAGQLIRLLFTGLSLHPSPSMCSGVFIILALFNMGDPQSKASFWCRNKKGNKKCRYSKDRVSLPVENGGGLTGGWGAMLIPLLSPSVSLTLSAELMPPTGINPLGLCLFI